MELTFANSLGILFTKSIYRPKITDSHSLLSGRDKFNTF